MNSKLAMRHFLLSAFIKALSKIFYYLYLKKEVYKSFKRFYCTKQLFCFLGSCNLPEFILENSIFIIILLLCHSLGELLSIPRMSHWALCKYVNADVIAMLLARRKLTYKWHLSAEQMKTFPILQSFWGLMEGTLQEYREILRDLWRRRMFFMGKWFLRRKYCQM